jgi:hypothetical protein
LKCIEIINLKKQHIIELENIIQQKDQEISDLKKSPRYDSIEDVRSSFFLNAMLMNQTKKEYELQDFGKWIVNNRMVCKLIENK